MLRGISKGLIRGKSAFDSFAPNPLFMLRIPYTFPVMVGIHVVSNMIQRKKAEDILGEALGHSVLPVLGKRLMIHSLNRGVHTVQYAPKKTWFNGLGGRSEMIMRPSDMDMNGRYIKKMTIVYHHANKAGQLNQRMILLSLLVFAFVVEICYNQNTYLYTCK